MQPAQSGGEVSPPRGLEGEGITAAFSTSRGGKSTPLSYLSRGKDTLIENHQPPVKYYLSKSLLYGFKYTSVSTSHKDY
jgi:hypothetical protein